MAIFNSFLYVYQRVRTPIKMENHQVHYCLMAVLGDTHGIPHFCCAQNVPKMLFCQHQSLVGLHRYVHIPFWVILIYNYNEWNCIDLAYIYVYVYNVCILIHTHTIWYYLRIPLFLMTNCSMLCYQWNPLRSRVDTGHLLPTLAALAWWWAATAGGTTAEGDEGNGGNEAFQHKGWCGSIQQYQTSGFVLAVYVTHVDCSSCWCYSTVDFRAVYDCLPWVHGGWRESTWR